MPRNPHAALVCALALGAAFAPTAHAALPGGSAVPILGGGINHALAPLALDPNVPESPYSGVVALDITWAGHGTGLCSGALISARHVLTAAHCVDPTDTGTPLGLDRGDKVEVVFNTGPTPVRVAVTGLALHPDFQGFDACPDGSPGCNNDDLAVITLAAAAPTAARIYRVWDGPLAYEQRFTLVGYGASGDGRQGFVADGTLTGKRVGQNMAELYERDDEQGFAAGAREVWYADYDGVNKLGLRADTFCDLGLACAPALGDGVEAMVGPGDSGGPALMALASGEYVLAGISSFAGSFYGERPGTFGHYMGGAVAGAYAGFVRAATAGAAVVVPEPGSWALAGLGLALLAPATRRRRAAAAAVKPR